MIFRKLFLTVLMLTIMTSIVSAGQYSRSELAASLRTTANEMNKNLPSMIDKETRIDSIGTIGTTMVYIYTLVNHTHETVSKDMKSFLHKQAVTGYCTVLGDGAFYRKNNITLKLHYRGIDGKFITAISLSAPICQK